MFGDRKLELAWRAAYSEILREIGHQRGRVYRVAFKTNHLVVV